MAVSFRRNAPLLTLIGFFFLYHSNFREQGTPSDTLDLKLVNFSILAGEGLNLAPVAGRIAAQTKRPYSDLVAVASANPHPPSKPIFTALPFLPIYWWYEWFDGPVNLFAVNFLGKFCAVAYAIALLAFCYGIGLNVGLSEQRALGAMAVFGAGTHVWHSVSQGLWSSTGFAAFFAAGLYFATRPRPAPRHLLAASACWGYAVACRQQDVLLVLPFFVFLALRNRSRVGWLGLPVVALGALGVAANYASHGSVLGGYASTSSAVVFQTGRSGIVPGLTGNALVGVPGLLVSPSRGLFVYTPFLVFPCVWFWRRYREFVPAWNGRLAGFELTLLQASGLSCVLELLLLGQYNLWWGGYSWGPRFLAPMMPTLFLLFILALPSAITPTHRRLLAACVLWAIFTQGLAAYKYHGWLWNWQPVDVDSAPQRVWDVRDSQIERAIREPWFKPNWETYSLDY